MNVTLLREAVRSRDFLLADLCIVAISGAVLCLFPDFGVWSLLIALIPWGFRLVAGIAPFQRTRFDWLIAVFVITAVAGYWASYDKTIAFTKLLLIFVSVLLFYALSAQPEENLLWVSTGLFCIGVGISAYFFLTHDFLAFPRRLEFVNNIGRWIMEARPSLGWKSIHPNYVSGIAAITTPFIFYPLWEIGKSANQKFALHLSSVLGIGVVLLALFMTTARGTLMAIASAAGVWVSWRIVQLNRTKFRLGNEAVFPSLVVIFLLVVVAFLFLGPAKIGGGISTDSYFGTGSRAELFTRSVYFLSDFPFTGAGLGAFPALYSHYVLGIPHYNVPNTHNLFLDVFIEQGLLGGLAFLSLYVASIWRSACAIVRSNSSHLKMFGWLALLTLVIAFIHGMVDDYLYYENGTILSMLLVGISVNFFRSEAVLERKPLRSSRARFFTPAIIIIILGLSLLNLNRIQSAWYANIGAVRMARVELAGFPMGGWAGSEIAAEMGSVETSFLSALEADPFNRTANHRLGLIAMLRRDFQSARGYLETAHAQSLNHRGIIKALGFCYVWLGKLDKAQPLLMVIPEAKNELDVYVWWWGEQGQPELSVYASDMAGRLNSLSGQP